MAMLGHCRSCGSCGKTFAAKDRVSLEKHEFKCKVRQARLRALPNFAVSSLGSELGPTPASGRVEAWVVGMPKTCIACGTSKGRRQFIPGQWKATNAECRTCRNAPTGSAAPAHDADHVHQVPPRVRPTRRGGHSAPQHQEAARKLHGSKAAEKLTAVKKKTPVKKKEPAADKKKVKKKEPEKSVAMKPPKKQHAEEEWLETELMATAAEKAAAVRLAGAGWAHLEEGSELARSLEMPFDAACSLQRQVLTEKVIQTRKKLGTKGPAILRSFQCDGVLKASREFEFPPLQVLERCLQQQLGMSAKEAQVALNEPKKQLSAKLLREFQSARSADGVTETLEQSARTRDLAAAFESAVQTRLKRTGVLFLTEDEQKSKASNAGVRSNPTPDFLIDPETDLVVRGAEVRWIEVKNFFGTTLGYHKQQLHKRLTNYHRLYGPGAVVFSLGAGESMRSVLVLASPGGGSPPPRARRSPADSDVPTPCAAETAVAFPEPTPALEPEPEPEPELEPQPQPQPQPVPEPEPEPVCEICSGPLGDATQYCAGCGGDSDDL